MRSERQRGYERKTYEKMRSDPVRHAAYLERKRMERSRRLGYKQHETERKEKWRKANPETMGRIRKANHAIFIALRAGKIKRPAVCSRCGKEGKVEAHHHLGYEPEHWLDVLWLCVMCHAAEHHPRPTKGMA